MHFPLRTVIVLLFIIGVFVLQVFLSRAESRWPGLLLPAIAFLIALLYPLNMVAPREGVNAGFIMQMLLAWLLANIPTLILLSVYFACRGRARRQRQIDKMNIQDLE